MDCFIIIKKDTFYELCRAFGKVQSYKTHQILTKMNFLQSYICAKDHKMLQKIKFFGTAY